MRCAMWRRQIGIQRRHDPLQALRVSLRSAGAAGSVPLVRARGAAVMVMCWDCGRSFDPGRFKRCPNRLYHREDLWGMVVSGDPVPLHLRIRAQNRKEQRRFLRDSI